jgi:hypothetical protein
LPPTGRVAKVSGSIVKLLISLTCVFKIKRASTVFIIDRDSN